MQKIQFLLFLSLLAVFGACSRTAERVDNVQPVPDVPTQTPEPVAPASDPPAEVEPTPVTEVESTPIVDEEVTGSVIEFSVSGGIVGFCDTLEIASDGTYKLARPCRDQELSGRLSSGDLDSLESWRDNLADFQITFEDNSEGADNLISQLIFKGLGTVDPEEPQQQVIFDWANGLIIRLNAEQTGESPPIEPNPVSLDGLCPDIARPALVTVDFENPNLLFIVDPDSQATCEVPLSRLPVGRIVAAAGNLFYPTFNPENETVAVLQISPDGEQTLLDFTQVPADLVGPADFVVSADGSRVSWSQTVIDFEVEPATYTNSLWVAMIDGTSKVAVFDQVLSEDDRFATPVQFSPDGRQLYYALQPDIPDLVLTGRYDTLYSVSTDGGETQEIYACQSVPFCIGGISVDGEQLVLLKPADGIFDLVDRSGNSIAAIPLPATDYIDRVVFAPNGSLAFASATLIQVSEEVPPRPDPGYLTFLPAPYTTEPQALVSDTTVGALWGWLDDTRLAYGALDEEGRMNTAVVTSEGEISAPLPNITVAVLEE